MEKKTRNLPSRGSRDCAAFCELTSQAESITHISTGCARRGENYEGFWLQAARVARRKVKRVSERATKNAAWRWLQPVWFKLYALWRNFSTLGASKHRSCCPFRDCWAGCFFSAAESEVIIKMLAAKSRDCASLCVDAESLGSLYCHCDSCGGSYPKIAAVFGLFNFHQLLKARCKSVKSLFPCRVGRFPYANFVFPRAALATL